MGGAASRVAFFVGDEAYRNVPSDYDWARRVTQETKASIPMEALVWTKYMSEIEDLSQRTQGFADLINGTYPNVVLAFSNGSNEYSFGGFIDHPVWDMSQISQGNSAIYLGATCLTADFARSYSGERGAHLFEEFLFTADRGAAFWIGPNNASWQKGNEAMLKTCVEKMYQTNGGSLSDCFTIAQREVLEENEGNKFITDVAKGYSFFGDPLSPFRGGGWTPVNVEDVDFAMKPTLQAHPNPFNPKIEIFMTLPTMDTVKIDVFDVKGRHIKSVFSGDLEAGVSRFSWDGKNDGSQACPAGVYLIRVQGI